MERKNQIFIYIFLLSGIFIVGYPFFFMVINSFKSAPEILHSPTSLPSSISFKGYVDVFKNLAIGKLFINSIFISACSTILNVVFSSMVAYGITKTELPYAKRIKEIILASMMIPSILLLIPTYTLMYNWNWINTYRVLIIPGMISAYNIFLMIQFMEQIDNSYIEAARIDGASELKIFLSVIFPMCKPAISTISILTFMGSWNDFLGPLLYLRGEEKMTVQLALYKFQSAVPGENLQQLWAATTLITLPIVIVYILLQKNFIQSFSGVGIK